MISFVESRIIRDKPISQLNWFSFFARDLDYEKYSSTGFKNGNMIVEEVLQYEDVDS